MWNYTIRFYYEIKSYFDYFQKKDDLYLKSNSKSTTNLSDEDKQKLELLEDELIELYEQIDIKYIYNCLHTINKELNENSNLKEILDFLYFESNFILQNKDNLEISLNKIKENTYVLELISKFKLLEDIKEKESFLRKRKLFEKYF
tara:strand:+ start:99 stop:536 length:438 start_codon:yes stop_codon:yes gene_type:complete